MNASENNWRLHAERRLADLLQLEKGWDSYEAPSIDEKYTQQALKFLDQVMTAATADPSIVPVPNGGIQLEWHQNGLDVEVDFGPEGEPELYVHDLNGYEQEGLEPAAEAFLEQDLQIILTRTD